MDIRERKIVFLLEDLKKYMPIVARVHGRDHEELIELKEVFDLWDKDLSKDSSRIFFKDIRKITNNYSLPRGACESFEKLYKDLRALEKIIDGGGGKLV